MLPIFTLHLINYQYAMFNALKRMSEHKTTAFHLFDVFEIIILPFVYRIFRWNVPFEFHVVFFTLFLHLSVCFLYTNVSFMCMLSSFMVNCVCNVIVFNYGCFTMTARENKWYAYRKTKIIGRFRGGQGCRSAFPEKISVAYIGNHWSMTGAGPSGAVNRLHLRKFMDPSLKITRWVMVQVKRLF